MADKKHFRPLDEELDDVAERVAAAKNIPTLTPPTRGRADVPSTPTSRPAAPVRSASAALPKPGPREARPEPERGRGVTQIRIRCPDHLSDQLVFEQQRLRRTGQRVTLNYLILSALRKAGYRVEEADLVEDGRRLR